MGDPNQFGSAFSAQHNTFMNNSQNVPTSQQQAPVAPVPFSSSGANSGFGLFSTNAEEASGAMGQDSGLPQAPSNLFSNPGPKSLFGTSLQNTESGTSIFGGSAFSKPSESVFSSSVRPIIFGGSATVSNAQPLSVPNSDASGTGNLFASAQINSTVPQRKAEEVVSSGAGNIFGGAFTPNQAPSFKLNKNLPSETVGVMRQVFQSTSNSTSATSSTSTMKPSIFGGAYSKREESSAKSGFSPTSKEGQSDKVKVNLLSPETNNVSFDGIVSSAAAEKHNMFSSSKSAFGRFPSSGMVTSTLSNHSQERSDNQYSPNEDERKDKGTKADNFAPAQASVWDTDTLEGVNRDHVPDQPRKFPTNKLNRVKRGVFGKALADVAKSPTQSDEMRSIICHPLDGELADLSILKEYFQQYGQPRVSVNKEKRCCVATYKTHEDAEKAMKGSQIIDGVKYRYFWRNMSKTRRKSVDDEERLKPNEERKRVSKRSNMDIDDDVREELAAISGMDYLMPQDTSSKRKAIVDREVRKKSRSVLKSDGIDPEVREMQEETYEPVKRNVSISSKTEGSKDIKSRISRVSKETRMDEKPLLHSRSSNTEKTVSKKPKDDYTDSKQEKSEGNNQANSAVTTAITSELMASLKQQATTSEEKLRVLDIRDKLIRHLQPKQYDISKAVKTVGTCPDMCPEKERLLRETRRQISQYEMSPKTSEMDPNLMVKQYSRSSADQEEPLPHDLRPPAVLTMTMNYLMHTIMIQGDEPGENLGEWYHFLWDRLRGIRKEITQQELSDIDAVSLVEQCARFHIHCGARLVAEDMSVFDDRINTENLTKCLQTLKHMYCDLWMNNSITCPNEPEFISYFLLLNLNNGTIMWEMEQLREEVLKSPEIGFVASMYNSLSSNNFIRFFRLVRKASYLNSCLCIRYFHQVRAKALKTYIKALAKIRPVQYPLGSLVDELGFENADHAAAFCSHYGLQVDNASTDTACVILTNDTFEVPSFALPSEREFRLAESKKMGTVGEVVYGGPLPPRLYENHVVRESFDENGFLLKSAVPGKVQISGVEIRELGENVFTEVTDNQPPLTESVMSSGNSDGSFAAKSDKDVVQTSTVSFGGFGNSKLLFPPSFTNLQPSVSKPVVALSNEMLKASSNFLQTSSAQQETKTDDSFKNMFLMQAEQARAKIEAEKKAQAAELEKLINSSSEIEMQDLLQSSVKEATTEIALLEWQAAEEQQIAIEKQHAIQQLQAQEELRKRILETTVDRISNDSFGDLVDEVVKQMVAQSAQEVLIAERDLAVNIHLISKDCLESIVYDVIEELCCDVAMEEKRKANESARQEAIKRRVQQVFYYWLEKARRSLRRKRVMHDFPASVIPLSIKEHAQRWSLSKNDEADAWESCFKGNEKVLDIPELKAMPAYPQITFAELIAVQAVHRYDTVRVKLGLHSTDKLLYKLFVSVPEERKDPAGELVDWWIRRTLKQNCGMICDDVEKGVYRIVSGVKVTSEVAVYASLQMVRGSNVLEKQTSLASGTSAILFSLSPSSSIEESRSRLTTLLKSISKLPPVPLVIAVVCPVEPPLEGLKQLVALLELDQWLDHGAISDYQILHVEEHFDLKYLSERFNMSFNYMVMTWTPIPEFALVCLKNVLRSTFQMFFISIQFNYNSSELYPQDIDDPRVIIGLCNEWLDHMCHEFVSSYQEAKDLCGKEFWPLLHKGAYLPFLNNPKYEELLQEVMRNVSLPLMEWPPSSESELERILTQYCSWLRPDDRKQTSRRLSCMNGLEWSEKISRIPWVNLVEDWMEARINYLETSVICGTEFLCLMRAQNVERLYTYPWWAHSQHIVSYLEANGSGRECEMDVDQTVPIENTSPEDPNLSSVEQKEEILGLDNFKEVTESVNELKKVNESLVSRLRSALADDGGSTSEFQTNRSNESVKEFETKTPAASSNFDTLVKNIDLEVKAHQDLRSNINNMLTKALAEEVTHNPRESTDVPQRNEPNPAAELAKTTNKMSREIVLPEQGRVEPSKKMDEIMASVNDIVSSLNRKYKILEDVSTTARISDLKLGFAKVDVSSTSLSEKLDHSIYVEQSKIRMMERLHGSTYEKNTTSPENYQPSADSDLDVLSDDRSMSPELRNASSPSYVGSGSEKSASDVEEKESFSENSEYDDKMKSKKRLLSNDSDDDDSYSGSRTRRHHNETEDDDYSEDKNWHRRRTNKDEDYSSQDVRHQQDDSEDEKSVRSSQESEYPTDDEEVQTITSDDSREATSNHQNLNQTGTSPSQCDEEPLIDDVIQPVPNSYSFEPVAENDLAIEENSGSHLTNLDNPHHYQSYYIEGVEDPVFTVSSEMGVLNSAVCNDIVVSNNDLISQGNDNVLVSQFEPSSDNALERVYGIEADRSCEIESSDYIPDQSEDTQQSTCDEGNHSEHDDRHRVLSGELYRNIDEGSGSEVEECETVEEEEYDDGEAEVEGDEEECLEEVDEVGFMDEEEEDEEGEEELEELEGEEELEEEEGEEEVETEPETEPEPEEDSDVCEVIDDD